MTPKEAIKLLEDATGHESFVANRRSHLLILEAIDVLKKATEEKAPKKAEK